MEIYAHRTARGIVPENSLEGSSLCLKLGIDYLDVDCLLTKDGVLVATHDFTLNPLLTRDEAGKYISEKIPIQELTFEQLQTYDVGRINPKSQYATYFPDQKAMDQVKIPSLKQVIQNISNKGIGIQIEIKIDPTFTPGADQFEKMLSPFLSCLEKIEVQSDDFAFLEFFHTQHPHVPTSFVTFEQKKTIPPEQIRKMGGKCWSIFQKDVTKELIEKGHALGLKVLAWGYPEVEGTEFDQTHLLKLIKWGVDGIITDRPDKLITLVQKLK